MATTGCFNSFTRPSSFDDLNMNYSYSLDQSCLYDESEQGSESITVPQNLEPEQYNYEFPPRSRLQALAYLDNQHSFSFFDESSFTTNSTSTARHSILSESEDSGSVFGYPSSHSTSSEGINNLLTCGNHKAQPPRHHTTYSDSHFFDPQQYKLTDDSRLSPLQLPAQFTLPHQHYCPITTMKENSTTNDRPTNSQNNSPVSLDTTSHEIVSTTPDSTHFLSHQQSQHSHHHPLITTYSLQSRSRERSCDSFSTITQMESAPVHPSSFLSLEHTRYPSRLSRVEEEEKKKRWRDSLTSCVTPNRTQNHWHATATSHNHVLSTQRLSSFTSDNEFDLPIFWNESEPMTDYTSNDGDSESDLGSNSKIFIVRLNRTQKNSLNQRWGTVVTHFSSDEGYDDDDEHYDSHDEKEAPLDSDSVFLPLSDIEQDVCPDHDLLRHTAAIKIQSLWRGYQARKTPSKALTFRLVRLCGRFHQRQMAVLQQRLETVEHRLYEETAMRSAFEKAMEDMTVLMDRQQATLRERVEQEVEIRETYEHKIEMALSHLGPLETKLRKQTEARVEMQDQLERVLDQMEDLKTSSALQAKEEAEARKVMQKQLDEAMAEIARIKSHTAAASSSVASSSKVRSTGTRTPQKTPAAMPLTSTKTPLSTTLAMKTRRTNIPLPPSKPTLIHSTRTVSPTQTPLKRTLYRRS
ncbi:hypothetical protein BDF14DRAFT_1878509 [Spinellus fusiger]|nr:hypothetical protein BDF14DRAFT_1878509 [Spinellus fusiger]